MTNAALGGSSRSQVQGLRRRAAAVLAIGVWAVVPAQAGADGAFPERSWAGGFAGFYAGQAFAGRALEDIVRISGPKGHLFGAQLGWDWQWGRWVLGIAADISHTRIDTSFLIVRGSVRWMASLRGRIGLALDRDTLLYVTAGPAIGRGDIRALDFVGTATHIGLMAGGGLERRVSGRISAFVEYRYTAMPERPYDPLPLKAGYEGHLVLLGLQFR